MNPHDRIVGLGRQLTEVRRARHEVDAFCRSLAGEFSELAQLLTSELVTNAITHGRGRIELRLTWESGRLRVAVHDESRLPPRLQVAGPSSTGGRGLVLLENLATEWGSHIDPAGKVVWFTLLTR